MIFCRPTAVTCEAADFKRESLGQSSCFSSNHKRQRQLLSQWHVYPAEETSSNTLSIGVLPNVQAQMENLMVTEAVGCY